MTIWTRTNVYQQGWRKYSVYDLCASMPPWKSWIHAWRRNTKRECWVLPTHEITSRLTLRAHETLSNRAPVLQNRQNHTLNGSSQAVIRFASSGTSNRLSSPSVRVQTRAATRPPAEVPDITRGRRSWSKKALTTPKWSYGKLLITVILFDIAWSRTYSTRRLHHQRGRAR